MAGVSGKSINDDILKSLKALTSNKSTSDKMKSDIDMQTTDWLSLLVAQLKNQDMNNTMDTGQMMSQMAQFSQIQSIQNMVSMQEGIFSMNTTSYAASLIGKEVTVAEVSYTVDSKGNKVETLETKKGTVSGVTLFEGEPIVYINEKPYTLSQIMIVGDIPDNPADVKPPEEGETDPDKDPDVDPDKDPTVDPGKDPTVDPGKDPTVDPEKNPTT